ncbi:NRDE family protein [Rhodoferax sp. U2-2l]|uniref:NRDE family protein n=1 Tax=Rhodoferax sp. U2-2l TaxID=2884000 RepID=UPI001D09C8D3|nr:NRDE family protein [Rhodoferax sp. U2-2l]MCB8747578.1 NRDE family protein [Rhodoferax sp. U2-2l]
MCLIAWHWQPGSTQRLLLVANRDEFYARPTAPLHAWAEADILAGRDLQAGGTWLGVSRTGRLAALTNHRDPTQQRFEAPSRGELVSAFLRSDLSAEAYLSELRSQANNYNPFNLLVYDGNHLMGLESRHARVLALSEGMGAVSNADFQTPWPKLNGLTKGLQQQLSQGQHSDTELLALLQDRRIAADADLPTTGVPLPLERALSAVFVALPDYGTRASSVVRLSGDHVDFTEQGFDAKGPLQARHLRAKLAPKA